KDKSYAERAWELARELPQFKDWKSLRGTPVLPQVAHALSATAILTLLSLGFSVLWGLLLLWLSENFPARGPALAHLANAINTTPMFLIGIFFIWLFAFVLRLLPSGGDSSLRFFILPAWVIASKFGARLFLLLQNYMQQLENKTFILRARAFGFGRQRIFVHKLANCAMPFLIFWLIETAALFSGAVITESLFSIHGLGQLLLFALLQYDIRLVFANLTVIATIVYFTSLLQRLLQEYRPQ
ncbi:MAG: ABC transporter permease subunit, partial [Leptospiraceae bacterium]|nr:ABC transporter permease subunit [Leptospiraceae bacterium]